MMTDDFLEFWISAAIIVCARSHTTSRCLNKECHNVLDRSLVVSNGCFMSLSRTTYTGEENTSI